jgi:hypothetical protein
VRGKIVPAKQNRSAARASVSAYRKTLAVAAQMDPLELFFTRFEFDRLLSTIKDENAAVKKGSDKIRAKAARKNSLGALSKLTDIVDGRRVIVPRPPLIVRLDEDGRRDATDRIDVLWNEYLSTVSADRRVLLGRYSLVDVALKVVGVGSVGTRCLIASFESGDGEPLFLQLKEATASVLEPYLAPSEHPQAGQRVVTGQQVIQAAPDAFLGWGRLTHSDRGSLGRADEADIDFYFRQLWDGKFSATVEEMVPVGLERYARWCGAALARAHARSGDASMISGYLGDDATFDKVVAAFAEAYADRTLADHTELVGAVEAGEIPIVRDL